MHLYSNSLLLRLQVQRLLEAPIDVAKLRIRRVGMTAAADHDASRGLLDLGREFRVVSLSGRFCFALALSYRLTTEVGSKFRRSSRTHTSSSRSASTTTPRAPRSATCVVPVRAAPRKAAQRRRLRHAATFSCSPSRPAVQSRQRVRLTDEPPVLSPHRLVLLVAPLPFLPFVPQLVTSRR